MFVSHVKHIYNLSDIFEICFKNIVTYDLRTTVDYILFGSSIHPADDRILGI